MPAVGAEGTFATRMDAVPLAGRPARRDAAIRALPPVAGWVNVRGRGVRGDDATDDTAAIRRAIDGHRVLYYPAGFYRVGDTLKLRADSVLIGLHPSLTQIVLADDSVPYRRVGSLRALIESAKGGGAILSGLGLATGGRNPHETALLWRAGEASLIGDVKFQGGHGTNQRDLHDRQRGAGEDSNSPSPGYGRPNLTVQCAIPFLPRLVRDRCATAGITQCNFGSSNANFPDALVQTDRRQYRFVDGLKGRFDVGGTDWSYDAYHEHGITRSAIVSTANNPTIDRNRMQGAF